MNFQPSKLKLWLSVFSTFAMVLSAEAQQDGRSIIFSTPQNNDTSATTPSLTPQTPDQQGFASQFQAPSDFLKPKIPVQQLPTPQPQAISQAGQERLRQSRENQQNWAFMTPEEIFGVAKPETDALGQEKKQTPMERYLDRQNQLQNGVATNGLANGKPGSAWDFFDDRDESSEAGPPDSQQGDQENLVGGLNQFWNDAWNKKKPVKQGQGPGWNPFRSSQPQLPKLDFTQQAEMARFRQLLYPNQPSVPNAEASSVEKESASSDSKFFPVPKLATDPNITQPAFVANPSGTSFTPLSDGISRPTGLSPLPGIVTPVTQTTVAPSWAPQPPPWLSQGPQLFVVPTRKF
jgi:hypothetical protein